MSRMQNLTLASAKHLLNMGHITPQHHKQIVAAAMKPMKMPMKPPTTPAPKINIKKPPGVAFGSLGGAGMLPGIGPQTMNAGQMTPPDILSGGDE